MQDLEDLRRPEAKTMLLYTVVAWVSGITIISVIAYGLASSLLTAGGVGEIGETLVNVEFPFAFMAKPVTYLSMACVTFFYSSVRLWENRIAMWSRLRLSILELAAIVVAFGSAYEVLYNFMLWGANYTVQLLTQHIPNPDIIASPSVDPWNLVFATKMFAALFLISGYSLYFMRKLHQRPASGN